ncbi:uncharacterized protein I303_102320 [Kwoniella dejecticola CBS 10117]|uniref:Uncharacterized protein n=1 Tax=Kwoniella dejecticola CBS 10117 TaxID=1296121 RepID=A0A1A6ABA4_9TREE|nr:uncharacterized protein I303_01539 [Kwoniella dejecticola CBS 10117]OBR87337.1 hypothetical protein I303_01539 [Kwoniella dejecticola CBS 10117]
MSFLLNYLIENNHHIPSKISQITAESLDSGTVQAPSTPIDPHSFMGAMHHELSSESFKPLVVAEKAKEYTASFQQYPKPGTHVNEQILSFTFANIIASDLALCVDSDNGQSADKASSSKCYSKAGKLDMENLRVMLPDCFGPADCMCSKARQDQLLSMKWTKVRGAVEYPSPKKDMMRRLASKERSQIVFNMLWNGSQTCNQHLTKDAEDETRWRSSLRPDDFKQCHGTLSTRFLPPWLNRQNLDSSTERKDIYLCPSYIPVVEGTQWPFEGPMRNEETGDTLMLPVDSTSCLHNRVMADKHARSKGPSRTLNRLPTSVPQTRDDKPLRPARIHTISSSLSSVTSSPIATPAAHALAAATQRESESLDSSGKRVPTNRSPNEIYPSVQMSMANRALHWVDSELGQFVGERARWLKSEDARKVERGLANDGVLLVGEGRWDEFCSLNPGMTWEQNSCANDHCANVVLMLEGQHGQINPHHLNLRVQVQSDSTEGDGTQKAACSFECHARAIAQEMTKEDIMTNYENYFKAHFAEDSAAHTDHETKDWRTTQDVVLKWEKTRFGLEEEHPPL